MVIVDTNIIAYLLIEGDRTAEARHLHKQDADWRTEPFLLIEFSNVLATYARVGSLNARQAADLLKEAETFLASNLYPVSHTDALRAAAEFSVSAYDARFLALARMAEGRLVTEDTRLRAAAPHLTRSLAEAVQTI